MAMTKAELEEAFKDATGEIEKLREELAALHQEHREVIEALKATRAKLAETPLPAPAPAGTPIGLGQGVYVLIPAEAIKAWEFPLTSNGQYVIDVTGDHASASRVAHRLPYPVVELSDGTFRATCPNRRAAEAGYEEARKFIRQEVLNVQLAVSSLSGSALQAADAARSTGFGVFAVGGQTCYAFTSRAKLTHKPA